MGTLKSSDSRWLLVIAIGLLLSCGSEPPDAPPPLRPVRVVEVTSSGTRRTRTFAGVAEADVQSNLSFRVRGNIQRLLVRTGDRVDAGQLIAELDPTDYQLQVQESQAALVLAEAQARQADAEYDRVRGLYENRNAARSDLDNARARAESTRAQIDAAMQRLEQARSQLSYTRLRAPTAGSIASVPVEVNENVSPGDAIAVLTAGSREQVNVAVPESIIGQITRETDVDVAFDALPGRRFEAQVSEVGVMTTSLGTTFPVQVQLLQEDPDVRSGMSARVTFVFEGSGEARDRYVVPPQAVAEDRDGRFVFVVEPTQAEQGQVRRRAVRVGDLTGEGLEVLEGLTDGDLVVTAGVSQIHDGLTVKLSKEL